MQTNIEKADAERVSVAIKLMQIDEKSQAEIILHDVCSRCPDKYEYEIIKNGARYIKFWDVNEFFSFAAKQGKQSNEAIFWQPSAYPRACYYLAQILVENGEYEKAIKWLQKGSSMEPQSPKFQLELGYIFGIQRLHQKSFDYYREAYYLASDLEVDRVVSLRGMAVQLIEMNQLDEAEILLNDSLTIEPDNENAKMLIKYIYLLRS